MNNVCSPRLNFKCLVISPCQKKFTDPIFEAAEEVDFPEYYWVQRNIPLVFTDWNKDDGEGDQLIITGPDMNSFFNFIKKYQKRIPVSPEEIELIEDTGLGRLDKQETKIYEIMATKLAQKLIEVMNNCGLKIPEVRTNEDLDEILKITKPITEEELEDRNKNKENLKEKLMHGVLKTDYIKNIYLKKALNLIDPTFIVEGKKQHLKHLDKNV